MRGFTFRGLAVASVLALGATDAGADGPVNRGSIKDHVASFGWTGLYVGAAVGYGTGTSELSLVGGSLDDDIAMRGVQGAVSTGYDFQVGSRWVLGVFADYAFGEIDGNLGAKKHVIDNQWAIGSRIGLLATPSTLLYASGGYTRADFEALDTEDGVAFVSKTLNGFFVGLGVEQAINRNLSLKFDYRFSDYQNFTFDGFGGLNFDNEVHSVRLGVNWKFGRD